jgi:hypothetical protein
LHKEDSGSSTCHRALALFTTIRTYSWRSISIWFIATLTFRLQQSLSESSPSCLGASYNTSRRTASINSDGVTVQGLELLRTFPSHFSTHSKGLSCSNPPETCPSIRESQHSRCFDSTLFNSCTYCSINIEQQAGKVTIALRISHRVDFHPRTLCMPTYPSQPHNHPPLPSDTRNQAKKPPQPTQPNLISHPSNCIIGCHMTSLPRDVPTSMSFQPQHITSSA